MVERFIEFHDRLKVTFAKSAVKNVALKNHCFQFA
jgi:hypothetical protein